MVHFIFCRPLGGFFNPERRHVRREEKIREEAVLREQIFIPIRFSDRAPKAHKKIYSPRK